jgi:hypothetical protein
MSEEPDKVRKIARRVNSLMLVEMQWDETCILTGWLMNIFMDEDNINELIKTSNRLFIWRCDNPNQARNIYRLVMKQLSKNIDEIDLNEKSGTLICVYYPI